MNVLRFSLLIVFLCIVCNAFGQALPRICSPKMSMSHQGVLIPFSEPSKINIPLYLTFACSKTGRALGRDKPLIVLMEGALLRPKNYNRLAKRLARKGFVVALPDYIQRDLVSLSPAFGPIGAIIEERRSMGFRCPKNPQFATTKLISSVQLFFKSSGTRNDLRRVVDLNKVIIFGHSLGGDVSNRFFNSKCEAVESPEEVAPEEVGTKPAFFPRVLCEQFSPQVVSTDGVLGIVTYEGVNNRTIVDVSDGNFHVAIHSAFYQSTISNIFSGKAFNRLTATVRLRNANHYGPNNYVRQNDNQTPLCAAQRRAPEDAFSTSRKVQNTVIDSITEVISSTYNSFMSSNGLEDLSSLPSKPKLLVDDNDNHAQLLWGTSWHQLHIESYHLENIMQAKCGSTKAAMQNSIDASTCECIMQTENYKLMLNSRMPCAI